MATRSELQAKWKSEGRCTGCAAPKAPDKACEACLVRQRKKRALRKLSGLCACGKRPERRNRKSCNKCLKRMLAAVKAQVQKRKSLGLCVQCGDALPKNSIGSTFKCDVCKLAQHNQRLETKKTAMAAYGGVCSCCQESALEFLTIDHVDGNGAAHRKATFNHARAGGHKIYRWLIKNNYPSGFQVLCFNCNIGRYHNGGECPHKRAPVA